MNSDNKKGFDINSTKGKRYSKLIRDDLISKYHTSKFTKFSSKGLLGRNYSKQKKVIFNPIYDNFPNSEVTNQIIRKREFSNPRMVKINLRTGKAKLRPLILCKSSDEIEKPLTNDKKLNTIIRKKSDFNQNYINSNNILSNLNIIFEEKKNLLGIFNFAKCRKNESYIDFYKKTTTREINKEIQSPHNAHEIFIGSSLKNYQYSIINLLLNKKMNIKKEKTNKLKPIKNYSLIDLKMKEKNTTAFFDIKKYKKKYLLNVRPIKQYFFSNNSNEIQKEKIKAKYKSYLDKIKNNKDNFNTIQINKVENESNFEILEIGGEKSRVLTKLTSGKRDTYSSRFKNEDYHSIMKFPDNSSGEELSIEDTSKYYRSFSSYKARLKKYNYDRNQNDELSYKEIKFLSKKGFQNLRKKKALFYSKKIEGTNEEVQKNRQELNQLINTNLIKFNKNLEEILNNDL